jgi:hypothetical protein
LTMVYLCTAQTVSFNLFPHVDECFIPITNSQSLLMSRTRVFIFDQWADLPRDQGDQIGRIFANWVAVHFVQVFLEKQIRM